MNEQRILEFEEIVAEERFISAAYEKLDHVGELKDNHFLTVIETSKNNVYAFTENVRDVNDQASMLSVLRKMEDADDTKVRYITTLNSRWNFGFVCADCRSELIRLNEANRDARFVGLVLRSTPICVQKRSDT